MSLQVTRIIAVLLTSLVLAGLTTNGHLFGLMNVDPVIDALRIILAAVGLYIGFVSRSLSQARTYLMSLGVLYLGMAIIGLASPTIFGLLPAGLTGFDIVFHLAAGALAAWAGVQAENRGLAHR
jgi:hypothetical protein